MPYSVFIPILLTSFFLSLFLVSVLCCVYIIIIIIIYHYLAMGIGPGGTSDDDREFEAPRVDEHYERFCHDLRARDPPWVHLQPQDSGQGKYHT